jgi:hypothetical protein
MKKSFLNVDSTYWKGSNYDLFLFRVRRVHLAFRNLILTVKKREPN